jgi:FkbM family methyltransferase
MKEPKFYSQNGEDYLLWKFFEEKRSGFYVDVGAFDGIHLSNTYTFESLGWQGICIEANPEIFAICRQNRTNALCLNEICVGQKRRRNKAFFVEETGLLSTTIRNREKTADIKQRYKNRGLSFTGFKKVRLKASTLNEILERYLPPEQRIDFVSIDTEGNEMDILAGIDFTRFDIRVLVVEFDKADEEEMAELLMVKGNYLFVRKTLHNSFFVKSSEDLKILAGIPINCLIQKQLHPKGLKYTTPAFQKDRVIKE